MELCSKIISAPSLSGSHGRPVRAGAVVQHPQPLTLGMVGFGAVLCVLTRAVPGEASWAEHHPANQACDTQPVREGHWLLPLGVAPGRSP